MSGIDSQAHGDGVVTYWTVSSETSAERLKDNLDLLGLGGHCPRPRRPQTVLFDALNVALERKKNVVVTALKGRDGFQVTHEKREEDCVDYSAAFTARRHEDDSLTFAPVLDADLDANIRSQFVRLSGIFRRSQVNEALVRIVGSLSGVTLRDTGGVYWMPADSIPRWEQVIEAVDNAALAGPTRIYKFRHPLDPDALTGVRDGLVDTVEAGLNAIAANMLDPKVGVRALQSKRDEADRLVALVTRYEDILGQGLDALKDRAERLRDNAAIAALRVAAESALPTEERLVA